MEIWSFRVNNVDSYSIMLILKVTADIERFKFFSAHGIVQIGPVLTLEVQVNVRILVLAL